VIASFANNFIFIRTRKTAGTSTEIVLSSWCAAGDIVMPIDAEDEVIRYDYGGEPRNFCSDPQRERAYRAAVATRDRDTIQQHYWTINKLVTFNVHASAAEVRAGLPAEFFTSAFKFAVDRHPYEKVISLVYWRKRAEIAAGASPFDFLDDYVRGAEYRNFDLYAADGRLLVDRVLRYEDLWRELAQLAQRWGKPLPAVPPRAKGRYRHDRRPAAELLSPAQKRLIVDICREEFVLHGYQP
jgi:hypothetical protein